MNIDDIKKKYTYSMPMQVRDYEVDSQGIVNNANYLHYLEHTRHRFCAEMVGVSFRQMHESGIDPVLRRVTIDYRHPLELGQDMISCLSMHRRGPVYAFEQAIYTPEGQLVVEAEVQVVCLVNGRLSRGDELAEYFMPFCTE